MPAVAPANVDRQARRRRRLWFAVKLAVSAGLIAAVASSYDISGLAGRLRHLKLAPASFGVAALVIQVMLAGHRWRTVAAAYHVAAPWSRMLRFTFVGQFFSQLLPSTVGGDAVKGWLLYRSGARLRGVVLSVFADRVLGVIGLLLLVTVIVQLPQATNLGGTIRLSVFAVLLAGAAGIAVLALLPFARRWRFMRWPVMSFAIDLSRGLHDAMRGRLGSLHLLGVALLVHLLSVIAAWFVAQAVGLSLEPLALLIAIPITMLAATVPVTIGGWGVREGVLVGLLGTFGVPAEGVLAISIVFGLTLAVASLPGAALWFGIRQTGAAAEGEIERAWQESMAASPTKD